jgi:hypothetical protein
VEDQVRLQQVLEDVDFCGAENRREQIVAAGKILRPTAAQSRFSCARIGILFGGLSASIIEGQDKLGRSPPVEPGRPKMVSDEVERRPLTACFAADGFRMRPFVIVDRRTMEKDPIYHGYDDSTVCIVSQHNAFMTRKLIEIWAEAILSPDVEARRRPFGYRGKAILLLDGLGSRHTAKSLADRADRNMEPVFLVPHSSDQTQPLDLLTVAVHMEEARQLRRRPDFGPVPRAALPSDAQNQIRLRTC